MSGVRIPPLPKGAAILNCGDGWRKLVPAAARKGGAAIRPGRRYGATGTRAENEVISSLRDPRVGPGNGMILGG